MIRLWLTAPLILALCATLPAQTEPASLPQPTTKAGDPTTIQGFDQRLTDLRDEIEAITGRADLSGQRLWPPLNDLLDQSERLKVTLAGLKAKEEAIQAKIAELTAEAREKLKTDETLVQLQQAANLKESAAARANDLRKQSLISASEADAAVSVAAEAMVRIAERREAILAAAGGGALTALNRELLSVSLDVRQQQAMLDYLEKRLTEYRRAQALNKEYIRLGQLRQELVLRSAR